MLQPDKSMEPFQMSVIVAWRKVEYKRVAMTIMRETGRKFAAI